MAHFVSLAVLKTTALPSASLASLLNAPRRRRRDEKKYDQLAAYCARDVTALAELVLKSRIRLSDVSSTDSVSLRAALGLTKAPSPTVDTRTLQQGSEAWHEARRGLITASLAPALLQLSPFLTRTEAFERLLGATGPEPTEHQRRGAASEAGVVGMYMRERRLEASDIETTGLWKHPRVQWLAASPDRLLGQSLLLEVKTTSRVGVPTPAFLIQIMIQLACTQRRQCDLAQYDYRTNKLRIDRVRFDMDLFKLLYKHLEQVASAAADARALGTQPDDAHIAPLDRFDYNDLRDEINDTLKTHVDRLL